MEIFTCAGGMKLIYLNQFPDLVEIYKIDEDRIVIPFQDEINYGVTFDAEIQMPASPRSKIQQKIIELDKEIQISGTQLRISNEINFQYLLEEAVHKLIIEDFKLLVAKKDPEFFLKDLNMNAINDLSTKYAQEGGYNNCYGIHIELGPYQKFFVVVDIEDFKFYYSQWREMNRDAITIKGKLINMRPNRLIMGRYENLEYLKELNSTRMIYDPIKT